MQYITTISQKKYSNSEINNNNNKAYSKGNNKKEINSIEKQILLSNPILESFGNARTIRNDNSSRFGKFIEIKFSSSQKNKLIGASIETYLLEKVRLLTQTYGERNFHIFYEIFSLQQKEKKLLFLNNLSVHDFNMTSMSNTFIRRDNVNDIDTFNDLKNAMHVIGFTDQKQINIFSIISALLHGSNISFQESSRNNKTELIQNNKSVNAFVTLLGISIDMLNDALCTCTIMACGEKLIKNLSIIQSTKAIEALIKATYKALFTYIVQRVNKSIISDQEVSQEESSCFIGVLDIFGFESFENNSFEQLCINYCNETLQQQFNKFIFKLEQQEYEREGKIYFLNAIFVFLCKNSYALLIHIKMIKVYFGLLYPSQIIKMYLI